MKHKPHWSVVWVGWQTQYRPVYHHDFHTCAFLTREDGRNALRDLRTEHPTIGEFFKLIKVQVVPFVEIKKKAPK